MTFNYVIVEPKNKDMGEFITPKTDWFGAVNADSGLYEGDRFNYYDYNRIKNNIIFLRYYAEEVYKEFVCNKIDRTGSLGNDKTVSDYFYASEINDIEEALADINKNTFKQNIGETPLYFDNGPTMDFNELNRIESVTLDIYEKLKNIITQRRMLVFNLGVKGGF